VVKAQCKGGSDCVLCRETRDIAARAAKADSRFRFIELQEAGDRFGYFGRNLAIQSSDAPLIAYLDDDNWWEPNHLESLSNALQSTGAFVRVERIVCEKRGGQIAAAAHHPQAVLHRELT